jgi:tripartite-type tricarboxylate transporter receptor subunit TctC
MVRTVRAVGTIVGALVAALLAAAHPGDAQAQAWPTKPIRVVVPNPAGGYYDILARVIGPRLGEALGQPIVVENRVGAGGMLGSDFVAKSPPDGYTLLVGGIGPHGIGPVLYPKVPYDPVKDFAPIVHVATSPNILVVPPGSPIQTVQELIAAARARPGQLNYGSNGAGTSQHLAAELFASAVGVKINHVPFKGSAPAVTAILAAQTDFMFAIAADVLPHIRAGKLRALASTGLKRAGPLPDTPTMIEAGVPGYESSAWFGYMAPAGTPREIVMRLNAEINRIIQLPDVKDRIAPQGLADLPGGPPERFGELVRSELAKWGKVVKDANVTAE